MLNMFPIRPRDAINGNYLHTYEGTGKKHENGKHIKAAVIEHSHLGLFESLSNQQMKCNANRSRVNIFVDNLKIAHMF